MPILDSEPLLLEAKYEGDNFKFTHAQYVDPIVEACAEEAKEDDFHNLGNRKRTFEKIASIPAIEFVKHPEWMHDRNAMVKWLKNEGRRYRTSRRRI